MAPTSSIYDNFIKCYLLINLLKQMFQMVLLHLKENNCANLFFNPSIKEEVMAWTSSIYDHFIICLQVTLTFKVCEQMFQIALQLIKENNCAKLFRIPCINYKLQSEQALFMTIFSFDLQV